MSTRCESSRSLSRVVSNACWCCRDMAATISADSAETARKTCNMICLYFWDSGSPANSPTPDEPRYFYPMAERPKGSRTHEALLRHRRLQPCRSRCVARGKAAASQRRFLLPGMVIIGSNTLMWPGGTTSDHFQCTPDSCRLAQRSKSAAFGAKRGDKREDHQPRKRF
jgi:hypothetical protein